MAKSKTLANRFSAVSQAGSLNSCDPQLARKKIDMVAGLLTLMIRVARMPSPGRNQQCHIDSFLSAHISFVRLCSF